MNKSSHSFKLPSKEFWLSLSKYLIKIAILIVLLIILLVITLEYFFPTKLIYSALSSLEPTLGRKIEIDKIKFHLFTGIHIYNLEINNPKPFSEVPLINVDEIILKYNLLDFVFKKKLNIKKIIIKRPQINLLQADNGIWDFTDLIVRFSTEKEDTTSTPAQSPEEILEQLEALELPIKLDINQFLIEDLALHLDMLFPTNNLQIEEKEETKEKERLKINLDNFTFQIYDFKLDDMASIKANIEARMGKILSEDNNINFSLDSPIIKIDTQWQLNFDSEISNLHNINLRVNSKFQNTYLDISQLNIIGLKNKLGPLDLNLLFDIEADLKNWEAKLRKGEITFQENSYIYFAGYVQQFIDNPYLFVEILDSNLDITPFMELTDDSIIDYNINGILSFNNTHLKGHLIPSIPNNQPLNANAHLEIEKLNCIIPKLNCNLHNMYSQLDIKQELWGLLDKENYSANTDLDLKVQVQQFELVHSTLSTSCEDITYDLTFKGNIAPLVNIDLDSLIIHTIATDTTYITNNLKISSIDFAMPSISIIANNFYLDLDSKQILELLLDKENLHNNGLNANCGLSWDNLILTLEDSLINNLGKDTLAITLKTDNHFSPKYIEIQNYLDNLYDGTLSLNLIMNSKNIEEDLSLEGRILIRDIDLAQIPLVEAEGIVGLNVILEASCLDSIILNSTLNTKNVQYTIESEEEKLDDQTLKLDIALGTDTNYDNFILRELKLELFPILELLANGKLKLAPNFESELHLTHLMIDNISLLDLIPDKIFPDKKNFDLTGQTIFNMNFNASLPSVWQADINTNLEQLEYYADLNIRLRNNDLSLRIPQKTEETEKITNIEIEKLNFDGTIKVQPEEISLHTTMQANSIEYPLIKELNSLTLQTDILLSSEGDLEIKMIDLDLPNYYFHSNIRGTVDNLLKEWNLSSLSSLTDTSNIIGDFAPDLIVEAWIETEDSTLAPIEDIFIQGNQHTLLHINRADIEKTRYNCELDINFEY